MLFKAEDEAFGKKYIEFGKTGKKDVGVYVLPKILDEQVALLHLEHVNAKLSKLSTTQAEYLGLPVEGPFKSDMYVSDSSRPLPLALDLSYPISCIVPFACGLPAPFHPLPVGMLSIHAATATKSTPSTSHHDFNIPSRSIRRTGFNMGKSQYDFIKCKHMSMGFNRHLERGGASFPKVGISGTSTIAWEVFERVEEEGIEV